VSGGAKACIGRRRV